MANFKLIVSNPYDGMSNSYELKDDVVLAQIESDNYFTFLYNFIRRN